jgi:pimeloyl-ACP methyl ester carboxylesterase
MNKTRVLISWLFCLFFPVMLFSSIQLAEENTRMKKYLYDAHHVRYELYQTNEGKPYNWLFFPGGPGADSSYLSSLVDDLELPGNVWLIDLPGNGSNIYEDYSENFDQWIQLFPDIIQQFDNPVLVGHSFGGMFPLLFPELENYLKGFVILNSAPVLWLEEAVAYSKQFDLPDLSKEMQEFTLNPNSETFKAALDACMPYYFPKKTLEKGRELLSHVSFQYQPAVWWQRKAIESNFSAKWIPQKVPTLIIGSKYDCICPFSLFKNDKRFQRLNVELLFIEDAGHMIWVENPLAAKETFKNFISRLSKIN